MPECPKCGTSVSIWSKMLTTDLCSDCNRAEEEARAREAEARRLKEEEERERHFVKGKQVVCPLCGHDRFFKARILMNTRGATFMNMDWANTEADTCACRSCGYVMWFRSDAIRH